MLQYIISIGFLLVSFSPGNDLSGLKITADFEISVEDSTNQKRVQMMLLPIIFKSPDTGIAFGVLPQAVFRTHSSVNPSSVRMDAYYTQQKQYHLLLRSTYWLPDDRINLSGKISFKKWPTSFYGIGNYTSSDRNEPFTEDLYEAYLEGTRRVSNKFHAGMGYGLRYGNIKAENLNGILNSGSVAGSDESFSSGISTLLKYDSRDNHFFPVSGSYHRIEFFTSVKSLGSDHAFSITTLDLRKYITLFNSHVLALQGVGMISGGTVPFRMLPSAGNYLRGYSSVRYIDRNLLALQAEHRVVPVGWRIGFTVFGGVGEVFNKFDDIHMNRLKYTAGIGLRYIFSREEKINIRIDYGMGRDSSGDYIDLTEAF